MENTPNTPMGILGNTETKISNRPKEVKQYCFTFNNYDDIRLNKLKNTLSTLGKWVFGYEVGEAGTPHLQGYINLKTKKTLVCLKKHIDIDAIHYETCKGSQKQNEDYCCKDGKWESNYLVAPYVEHIDNLYNWQIDINKILSEKPDKRSLYYFFEPNGCTGKTTYQKYVYTHFDECVVLSGKGADMKNGIVTYFDKNKKLPKIILINIPRESNSFVSWSGIEEIKDMFFYSGKYEGGMICGDSPHVLLFSNEPPPFDKVSKDRWKAFQIIENKLVEYNGEIDEDD